MSSTTSESSNKKLGLYSDPYEENSYALSFINRRPDDVAVATLAPVNTDLNFPPLQAWSYESSYEAFFKMGPQTNYNSSIDLGQGFLDETPTADFIGSGPTIKRLLMEPYSAGPMSLICHRVGKSIYLDTENFSTKSKDLQNLDVLPSSYWQSREPAAASSQYVQTYPSLSMYENLIWHSKEMCEDSSTDKTGLELALREYGPRTSLNNLQLPRQFQSYSYKIKPQDSLDGEAYLWEFHDMRMLVDVDLPIFGGGQFPSVSIRLSEEQKPISVLTGIDIMLDQLMCHIPETIMVYHQKGVIKEYDVVVKEEIPYLTGSEFDPSKLKVITENMLSFLTKNMTQQGHTYWLFREKGSDEMKLYDLTGLCPDLAKNPQWNPFLVPVIMLLYRLASKLMSETQTFRSEKVSNVIYGLLNAADSLLKDERMSGHRACVQYCLVGVYLSLASSSSKDRSDTSQDHLVDGLDDLITDGYARLSSSIKIDRLKTDVRGSSECDTTDQSMKKHLPGPVRIPSCVAVGDCCEQALEHCLEGLVAMDCSHSDEPDVEFPFVPDGPDDIAAFKSLKDACNDTVYHVLRHSVLVRAATAYSLLVNQAMCVDRHEKTFNFAKMGIVCCAAVLSSQPVPRHEAVCSSLLSTMISSLIHAMSYLSLCVTDVSALNRISYRDQQILVHAKHNVHFKDQYQLEKLWSFSSGSITWSDWTTSIDSLIKRCVQLIKDAPNAYSKIQFQPSKDAALPCPQIACRVAVVEMQLGGRAVQSARSTAGLLKEEMDESQEEENYRTALQHIQMAKNRYNRAADILNGKENKSVRECLAIVQINSVTAWKMEYQLQLPRETTDDGKLMLIVDHICSTYRHVFSLLEKDLSTIDGSSVYTNSLLEYASALIMFSRDFIGKKDAAVVSKRTHFLEAALRALATLRTVAGCQHQHIRSESAALSSYVYYQLLALKQTQLEPLLGTPKCKSRVRDFADQLRAANQHLIWVSNAEIDGPAKRVPPEYIEFTLFLLRCPTLTDPQKLDFCRLAVEWNLAVVRAASGGTSPWVDETRSQRLWKDVQQLFKWINVNWPKSDRLKKAYLQLLVSLPESNHDRLQLIIDRLGRVLELVDSK